MKIINRFNELLSKDNRTSNGKILPIFNDRVFKPANYIDYAFWLGIKVPTYKKGKKHKAPRKWKKRIKHLLKSELTSSKKINITL